MAQVALEWQMSPNTSKPADQQIKWTVLTAKSPPQHGIEATDTDLKGASYSKRTAAGTSKVHTNKKSNTKKMPEKTIEKKIQKMLHSPLHYSQAKGHHFIKKYILKK